jgi:hypothetical protein
MRNNTLKIQNFNCIVAYLWYNLLLLYFYCIVSTSKVLVLSKAGLKMAAWAAETCSHALLICSTYCCELLFCLDENIYSFVFLFVEYFPEDGRKKAETCRDFNIYFYIFVSNYIMVVSLSYCWEYASILGFNMSALVSALLGKASITEILLVRLLYESKGKAVPLQAWSGPEGSRKLR